MYSWTRPPDTRHDYWRPFQGLTNALKHAGPVPTAVSVRYQRDALTLEILNEGGRMPASRARESGHGLIGMRERVAFLDGDIETGRRPGGGFVVRARIPIDIEGGDQA